MNRRSFLTLLPALPLALSVIPTQPVIAEIVKADERVFIYIDQVDEEDDTGHISDESHIQALIDDMYFDRGIFKSKMYAGTKIHFVRQHRIHTFHCKGDRWFSLTLIDRDPRQPL